MAWQPPHREVVKMKRMVIMTVAAAGLIIGTGTAAVNPDFGPGNNSKGSP